MPNETFTGIPVIHPCLLIDTDVFIYKHVNNNLIQWDEKEEPSYDRVGAQNSFKQHLDDLYDLLDASRIILALGGENNFRYQLYPDYKANRPEKPKQITEFYTWVREEFKEDIVSFPRIETDDVLGYIATSPKMAGSSIIVSNDKDMKTVPTFHYNPFTGEGREDIVYVSEHDAHFNHMFQTLKGDSTDNIKGCPGIGEKRAREALTAKEDLWAEVVKTYELKGSDEDTALLNARLTYILQNKNYNKKTAKIKLWTP